MRVRLVRAVIYVGMAASARMDHLPRAQDRATILALSVARGRARSAGRELSVHIIRQTQAAARAGVPVGTADARGFLDIGGCLLTFEEVGMVFYFRRRLLWAFVGSSPARDGVGFARQVAGG